MAGVGESAGWTFVGFGGDDRDLEGGEVTQDPATRCTATFVRQAA